MTNPKRERKTAKKAIATSIVFAKGESSQNAHILQKPSSPDNTNISSHFFFHSCSCKALAPATCLHSSFFRTLYDCKGMSRWRIEEQETPERHAKDVNNFVRAFRSWGVVGFVNVRTFDPSTALDCPNQLSCRSVGCACPPFPYPCPFQSLHLGSSG